MQPLGVHHVSINVTEAARSIAFYTEVLGGSMRGDRPDFGFDGAWIDLGGAQVHLIAGDVPTHNGQHFAILVDDIDAAVEDLRAHGLTVKDPRAVGSGRQTFVEDPDGNLVEVHQAAAVSPA